MNRKMYFAIVVLALMMSRGFVLAQSGSAEKTMASDKKDIVDTAVAAGNFNTLATALKTAGLVETLKSKGPFTVFAPTDEAFAKLPAGTLADLLKPENKAKLAGILTYHVLPEQVMAADVVKLTSAKTVNGQSLTIKTEGGVVMVDGAKVVKTDIKCSNGVIHVIDAVVLPQSKDKVCVVDQTGSAEKTMASDMKDIVDTAVAAGNFNTLATALKTAGLVETLKSKGPFTVFAPTDKAFAKLPAGTLEDLLKPENKAKLAGILTYHVLPEQVMVADVVKLTSAKTVNGQSLTIKTEGGVVMVDGAKVVKTDIKCSNGVIHVIDAVVLPK